MATNYHKDYSRRHYIANKARYSSRARQRHLKTKFGMTAEAYAVRYTELGGLCASCQHPESTHDKRSGGRPRLLAVDHNHETNAVRDLLCNNCNTALGLLKEDPLRIEALAAYIRKHLR